MKSGIRKLHYIEASGHEPSRQWARRLILQQVFKIKWSDKETLMPRQQPSSHPSLYFDETIPPGRLSTPRGILLSPYPRLRERKRFGGKGEVGFDFSMYTRVLGDGFLMVFKGKVG